MSHSLLLPHKYKRPGWLIMVPAFILGLLSMSNSIPEPSWLNVRVLSLFPAQLSGQQHFFALINTNLTNTLLGALFILGGLLVGFSREKQEDEFIASLRLSSLLWAVLLNYIILFACFLLIYDTGFLMVMIYNMFTTLLIFILRFNYLLYRSTQIPAHEK